MIMLVGLAICVPIGVVLLGRQWPKGAPGAALRWLSILVCQVLAIGAVAVLANNTFGFYNSWTDLFGTQKQKPQAPAANGLVPPDGSEGRVAAIAVQLPAHEPPLPVGRQMGVLVWLPKQYDQPQYRHTRFPATMMLPGQPGTPQGVFKEFQFGQQAQAAIDAGQVKPFVGVLPPIMIDPPRDTECTDIAAGPQAETWLARNVREAVIEHFRVSPDGRQWSAMGWSTGGFCAAKLALRQRHLFNAAVGFGGYYNAETDRTTGDLFHGNKQLELENSPLWLVQQNRAVRSNLLIVVSRVDHASWQGAFYADSKAMIEASQGVPGVSTIVLPQGGHNYHVYRPTLPAALAWLGRVASL